MKQHFGVGITLNIVAGLVQFGNYGLLLAQVADLIEAEGKIVTRFLFVRFLFLVCGNNYP
jgi:hypothetical protein